MLELKWVARRACAYRSSLAPTGPSTDGRREKYSLGHGRRCSFSGPFQAFYLAPKYLRSEKTDKEVIRFQISRSQTRQPRAAIPIQPHKYRLMAVVWPSLPVRMGRCNSLGFASTRLNRSAGFTRHGRGVFSFLVAGQPLYWVLHARENSRKSIRTEKNPTRFVKFHLHAGGSWNRDGMILSQSQDFGSIYQVSDQGGTAKPLTTLDSSRGEVAHLWPHFLPDGRHFFYLVI